MLEQATPQNMFTDSLSMFRILTISTVCIIAYLLIYMPLRMRINVGSATKYFPYALNITIPYSDELTKKKPFYTAESYK